MWWLTRQTNSAGDWRIRTLRDGVQVCATAFDDLTPLMDAIGRHLQLVSQVSFLNQSFDGKRWPARAGSSARPSVLGAVADLSRGTSIAGSRFRDRPALVNTGALRGSIRYTVTAKTVRLTSTEPAEKARTANEGGTTTLPVSQTVRRNLATLLQRRPDLRDGLGFLFRRTSVSATVPPRPFLGVTSKSRAKIQEMTQTYLEAKARSAPEESG